MNGDAGSDARASERFLIWGAGGHGKVVADLVRACGHQVAGYADAELAGVGRVAEPGGARVVVHQDELVRRLADREITGLLTLLHDIEHLPEPDGEQEAEEAAQFSRWRTTAATTREAARPEARQLIGR